MLILYFLITLILYSLSQYPTLVCLVASGKNGEDMTTYVEQHQIAEYFEKYPGSYCGECGKKKECPIQ